MIFSGYTVFKGCTECDFEFSRTQPTSIFLVLGLACIGTGFLVPGLAAAFGPRWWYWVALPIAELVAIFLLMGSLVWLRDRVFPIPAKCPLCSAEMKSKGAGFHDFGCLPSAVEFLVLLLVAAAHVIVAVWLR